MMSHLHVLHVLDHSLPIVSGYSIRSHHVLRAQLQMGITPIAVTSPKHGPATDHDVIDNIEYLRVPAARAPGMPLFTEGRLMMRLAGCLRREVARRPVGLLHAHSPVLNGIPALWAARRARLPFVYEIRALWEDAAAHAGTQRVGSLRYRLSRALEGWLMRHADAVAAISLPLIDDLVGRGVPRSRIVHAPNAVDTRAFRPMDRDDGLVRQHGLDNQVVFGFLGTFASYEGLDVLMEAFAKLTRTVPQARLLLVGDGQVQSALRAQAGRLGIEPQVTFAGRVAYAEARRWYSVCDVLVYPRRSSRLTELITPLKPLEAMAMGKSVVASDVGGLRALVRHEQTGLLCAPGDADALARVLADVARQPQRRAALGAAARRWVSAERDWQHVAANYAGAYQIACRRVDPGAARRPGTAPDRALDAAG